MRSRRPELLPAGAGGGRVTREAGGGRGRAVCSCTGPVARRDSGGEGGTVKALWRGPAARLFVLSRARVGHSTSDAGVPTLEQYNLLRTRIQYVEVG